jgi:PAS domain S-box-containing protein
MEQSSPPLPGATPVPPPLPARLLLSAIVDSSDDAIVSKTFDGTITSWNRAAQRIFGYTPEEMIGQSVLRLIPPELQHEETTIIARLRKGERIEHFQSLRRRKDGSLVPVSLTISPIRDDHGNIVGASKIARDISEHKRTADAASLLAAIVESSQDAIISKDLSGRITTWNKAAEITFGYTEAEIIGQPISRLIPPELQGTEPQNLSGLRAGERVGHYETVRVRKDGERIDVSVTVSPIVDAQGTIIGASKIICALGAQRRAEQATRLLAAIVDSSDDAIISKTLTGVITSWNRGAERIFGYTADEMIGAPILKLIPPERHNEEPNIVSRLQRGERIDHYQTVRRRKNGELIDVSLTVSPIKDSTGRVIGASKVARDITQEKKAVAQLALANEELRRAHQMKSEFLAIMSHELRTPLNSIIGFATVMRQGRSGPLTEEQKKQLLLIQSSGKHLLHLINDVLDLSRIEAGKMEVEPEEFLIGDVVEEAIRILELPAAQKSLKVSADVAVTGPIFSDRKRVFQIVLNLLNNAVKFTPAGAVKIEVTRDGQDIVVTVRDTGIGIPRDKHRDLFQAFHQVEGSARRRYEGTGLGLYLCKQLVTLLHGRIEMESEVQRGSVFTFRIPERYQAVSSAAEAQLTEA